MAQIQFELDLRDLTITWFASAEEFVHDVCREREALQSFKEATLSMRSGNGILEAEQYGWISLLQRPRARKLVGTMIEIGQEKGQRALQQTGRWTAARVEGVMESIAGRVPAHPLLPPGVRRMALRDTLALPASKSELPALYRMPFRLARVEDRRFIVGRDREMAGLDQAVKDWRSRTILTVQAHVYDHRFAAAMKTEILRHSRRELLACGVLKEVDAAAKP